MHTPAPVQHAPVGHGFTAQVVAKPWKNPLPHPPVPDPGNVNVQTFETGLQHAPVQGLGEQEVPLPRHRLVPGEIDDVLGQVAACVTAHAPAAEQHAPVDE